jgi:beta-lactamase class A
MTKNRFSYVTLMAAGLVGGGGGALIMHFSGIVASPTSAVTAALPSATGGTPCTYVISRVNGFDLVHPLLSSEPSCESTRFVDMRHGIEAVIDTCTSAGMITAASVYLRDFQRAEWTEVNGNEPYDPGSLLKVPVLLTYLSMAENDAALLGRTWVCEARDVSAGQGKDPEFLSEQAQLNITYTLPQLLELMIVHSDNRATSILLRHMNMNRFMRTFTDIGLPAPTPDAKQYQMSVKSYSMFMKALYNSSYLSPTHSTYALGLMLRSTFRSGLIAGVPSTVRVAHKFGEAGNDQDKQLHETALVYADGNAYLLTVMTRGSDLGTEARVLAAISRTVYEHMTSAALAVPPKLADMSR